MPFGLRRPRGADGGDGRRRSLQSDAVAMRATLDGLQAEREGWGEPRGEVDLRALTRDLLEGEVEAPTEDVAWLVRRGTDPDEFYERELAPSWDGRGEAQRAARLEGFLELASMVEGQGDDVPREMAATVRTKTLLFAWAFDEAHGYISRLASGELDPGAA